MSTLRREIDRLPKTARKLIAPYLVKVRWAARSFLKGNSRGHGLPGELIVSLTSYPQRYGTLHLTLKALLSQSVNADKLLLWIARDDYAGLPKSVLRLQSERFEIRRAENLRSYLKLVPTLEAYPEAFIVTADDDVYYAPTWLEMLVSGWRGDISETVCHRAHRITLDAFGKWKPYVDWQMGFREPRVSDAVFPTGVGGVLYPPGSLHEMCTDRLLFQRLCPKADDIWFYWMTRLAGGRAIGLGWRNAVINWRGSQMTSLYAENVIANGNQRQLQALASYLGWPAISDNPEI